MNALDPTALNGRNERGMRVQDAVFTDFAVEAERFAIRRQQQFDGGGIETDAVVERPNTMSLVHAANDHHADKNLQVRDVARITRKQRLYSKRLIRLDNNINPGSRNI